MAVNGNSVNTRKADDAFGPLLIADDDDDDDDIVDDDDAGLEGDAWTMRTSEEDNCCDDDDDCMGDCCDCGNGCDGCCGGCGCGGGIAMEYLVSINLFLMLPWLPSIILTSFRRSLSLDIISPMTIRSLPAYEGK